MTPEFEAFANQFFESTDIGFPDPLYKVKNKYLQPVAHWLWEGWQGHANTCRTLLNLEDGDAVNTFLEQKVNGWIKHNKELSNQLQNCRQQLVDVLDQLERERDAKEKLLAELKEEKSKHKLPAGNLVSLRMNLNEWRNKAQVLERHNQELRLHLKEKLGYDPTKHNLQLTTEAQHDAIEKFLEKILTQNPNLNLLDYTLCIQDVVENCTTYKTYWLRKTT